MRVMSDYTEVWFELNDPNKVQPIVKYSKTLFDACYIKDLQTKGRYCYQLVIHELDLRESLPILDKLGSKFGIKFVVEYGVY